MSISGYFTPWRRKLGVVTLVMACLFAIPWIRTYSSIDNDLFWLGEWGLMSSRGCLSLLRKNFVSDMVVTVSIQQIYAVSYWCLVTPLTLLSAWLLLSKPRNRLPKPASEP